MITKTISFVFLISFTLFFSQTKEQLQKQNAEIKKQIQSLTSEINNTRSQSKYSISYLNKIDMKIGLREKAYQLSQKEKKFIEDDVYVQQIAANKYSRELEVLRKNYAEVLVNAYKNKGVQNKVLFILSAQNLGQAFRRVQYLKQYSEYQNRKSDEIMGKTSQIKLALNQKQKAVKQKEVLIVQQEQELLTIEDERKQRAVVVEDFKKNEGRLIAQLRLKELESKKLEGQIKNLIVEEIRLAKLKREEEIKVEKERARIAKLEVAKEKARIDAENKKRLEEAARTKRKAEAEERKLADLAKKRQDEERNAIEKNKDEEKKLALQKSKLEAEAQLRIATEKSVLARANEQKIQKATNDAKIAVDKKAEENLSAGSVIAGSNFSQNKGKLGFPVDRGTITHRFGRQPHPVFKGIEEENIGVKIAVPKGSSAKSVFAGVVSGVIPSGGAKNVIVKHGDYFTVYGNLSSTNVAKGQTIQLGQTIGAVGADLDGDITLDFQVYRGETALDPQQWVSQ